MDVDLLDGEATEAIYNALFALASGLSWGTTPRTFLELSRRVRLFSDADRQPALYQAEHGEVVTQKTNLPYKWLFEVNWIVYQNTGKDSKAVPAVENNLILGAIRKALAPKPVDPGFLDRRNTLNGLVYHCFIDGKVFKDPGDIDAQGMLVVPIKLLVP